ncbi:MAG TPA: hypothetical protein EYG79_04495 [Rhodobacteraceae bacterium]|nr:hypothetical protein [Paracoccaceae bacterium]
MAFDGNPPQKIKPKHSGWKILVIVTLVVVAAGFGVSKFMVSFDQIMRGDFAYTESVRLLTENRAAKAILGSPIEVGDILAGNVNLENLDGVAVYSLAVKGSKCEGIYYIRADKHMGTWDIYLLALQSECATAPLVIRNTRNVLFLGESAQEA